jgi:hypothetical protein
MNSLPVPDDWSAIWPPTGYSAGQAAPFEAHCFTFAANASRDIGTGLRPEPGFQPHATSLSVVMCMTIASTERCLFRAELLQQDKVAARPQRLAGGTIPFIRRYSTICP